MASSGRASVAFLLSPKDATSSLTFFFLLSGPGLYLSMVVLRISFLGLSLLAFPSETGVEKNGGWKLDSLLFIVVCFDCTVMLGAEIGGEHEDCFFGGHGGGIVSHVLVLLLNT